MGKIRPITGVDPNFRSNIDRLAQTAQYDKIDKLLRNKVVIDFSFLPNVKYLN